ncbi:MAG: RNA methyltransferase [Planctomycetaceae bacterium]
MQSSGETDEGASQAMHERIDTLDDSRLDIFRNLKTKNAVRDARLFVAEGATVVERVLRSALEVHSVLSDRKFATCASFLRPNVRVFRLCSELADELVGFHFHCGVMASAVRPAMPDPDEWIPAAGPSLIIAADCVVDPENVGALIRIASAFGADGVILGKGSADPFSRRVLRVSMGNVLFMPIVETDDLPSMLSDLSGQRRFQVCGTVLDSHAARLDAFRFSERTVLVFGNEYDGISDDVQGGLTHRLTIAMLNGTDSLNVAISAGIFCHQYRVQWGRGSECPT